MLRLWPSHLKAFNKYLRYKRNISGGSSGDTVLVNGEEYNLHRQMLPIDSLHQSDYTSAEFAVDKVPPTDCG